MDWNSSILWGIIGIICTIFFGFIFAYIFYKKGLKQKKIICYRNSTTLISNKVNKYEGLKISYNENEIQTLTSTSIIFKNVGNDIIEPNDIVPSDPIVIKTSGSFLSPTESDSFEVLSTNHKINAYVGSIDKSNIKLYFDYFPPKSEISVTLLHSGDISITGDIKVGVFKESAKKSSFEANMNYIIFPENLYSLFIKFNYIALNVIYILSIIALATSPLAFLDNKNLKLTNDDILLYISYAILGIFLLLFLRFEGKIKSKLFPKNDNDIN